MSSITVKTGEDLFDDPIEIEAFKIAASKYLNLGLIAGAELAEEQLGALSMSPEDIAALPEAVEAVDQIALQSAITTLEGNKAALTKVIVKALEDGKSNEWLAGAIKDKYDGFKKWKALRIARTETTRAVNKGTLETYKIEGIRYKVWISIADDRTRPTHVEADIASHSNPVPVGKFFNVGGWDALAPGDLMLPPSESINCRCRMVTGRFLDTFAKEETFRDYCLRQHTSIERPFRGRIAREFEKQLKRVLARL